MRDAIDHLSDEQIQFICSECDITEDELFAMDEDSIYHEIYDVMCDIESGETPTDGVEESLHCRIASEIVTVLGNAMAKESGIYYESFDD